MPTPEQMLAMAARQSQSNSRTIYSLAVVPFIDLGSSRDQVRSKVMLPENINRLLDAVEKSIPAGSANRFVLKSRDELKQAIGDATWPQRRSGSNAHVNFEIKYSIGAYYLRADCWGHFIDFVVPITEVANQMKSFVSENLEDRTANQWLISTLQNTSGDGIEAVVLASKSWEIITTRLTKLWRNLAGPDYEIMSDRLQVAIGGEIRKQGIGGSDAFQVIASIERTPAGSELYMHLARNNSAITDRVGVLFKPTIRMIGIDDLIDTVEKVAIAAETAEMLTIETTGCHRLKAFEGPLFLEHVTELVQKATGSGRMLKSNILSDMINYMCHKHIVGFAEQVRTDFKQFTFHSGQVDAALLISVKKVDCSADNLLEITTRVVSLGKGDLKNCTTTAKDYVVFE